MLLTVFGVIIAGVLLYLFGYPPGLSLINIFIGGMVMVIWSVVGFIFWIPLLTRSVATYTLAVTGALIAGQSTKGMGSVLPDAITFYSRGFTRIVESFRDEDTESPRGKLKFSVIFAESLWCIFFWSVFFFGTVFHFRPASVVRYWESLDQPSLAATSSSQVQAARQANSRQTPQLSTYQRIESRCMWCSGTGRLRGGACVSCRGTGLEQK